jgi:hypothetical protein
MFTFCFGPAHPFNIGAYNISFVLVQGGVTVEKPKGPKQFLIIFSFDFDLHLFAVLHCRKLETTVNKQ